jgi:pantoate--beta-alanine ligase
MILFKGAADLGKYLEIQKKKQLSVGFVPTMGALHQGHLSLLHASKKDNHITVCSVFINPTQFNNADDFNRYPVTIEKDIQLLMANGCDAVFLPPKEEIYPSNYIPRRYELGGLETILEGHYRPGHFQGVCQVVDRLLQIVGPDKLYVGQKDYQQCKVISKLIEITDRQRAVDLVVVPTVREVDGLAMSSRNLRLSDEQRKLAPAIFKALLFTRANLLRKPVAELKNEARVFLEGKGFIVDYFEIAVGSTLAPSDNNDDSVIGLVAAYIGSVRLIDNLPLN